MTTKPITMSASIWLGEYSDIGPQDFKQGMTATPLTFLSADVDREHWQKSGYTFVGTAEIQFTPISTDEMVANKVEALRAQKSATLAEAQAKATQIEGQIQKLLAIGCEVA